MSAGTANHRAQLFWRVGLWFLSLLVAVGLFTGLFCALYAGSPGYWMQALYGVFRITMIFAFPVACLYLPVVIVLRDAAKRRLWIVLVSGALIGPVCMALLSIVQLMEGQSVHEVLYGDPLLGSTGGAVGTMIEAFIVGTFTTVLYIVLLRIRMRFVAANCSSAA
jgi:hypothetical protein